MRKFVSLIIWWGSIFASALLLLYIPLDNGNGLLSGEYGLLLRMILVCALWLLSGIGRRMFHLRESTVEEYGLKYCIHSRIYCRRFYMSIPKFIGICAMIYGFGLFFVYTGNFLTALISGIVGFALYVKFTLETRYTCSYCGAKLVFENSHYDNKYTVEYSYSGDDATISQDVTDYYHCARCGRRTSISSKRNAGSIHFK